MSALEQYRAYREKCILGTDFPRLSDAAIAELEDTLAIEVKDKMFLGGKLREVEAEVERMKWMLTTVCEESRGTWTHLGTHDVIAQLEDRWAEREKP